MATKRNGNGDIQDATDPPAVVLPSAGPVAGPVARPVARPIARPVTGPVDPALSAASSGALSTIMTATLPGASSTPTSLAAPMVPGPTTPRNKRQELSFAERIQVIFARCGGKSMRQLASEFGCGKTQILNILGQRESYLREWEEKQGPSNPHISARKRRSRRTGNEETNKRVWEWYQDQKALGVRVTGPMLQREARSIARGLGIANFAASNGWLDSFRRLHNIVSSLLIRLYITSITSITSGYTPNFLSAFLVKLVHFTTGLPAPDVINLQTNSDSRLTNS